MKPVQGKPAFYAILFNSMKQAALDNGYALAIHGSLHRDMDLIAVPWTEEAKSVEELIKAVNDCLGETVWKEHNLKNKETKPHGRISYTLSIAADWFIDLSVWEPQKQKIK